MSQEEFWFVVSKPFRDNIVTGPLADKVDAITAAERLSGYRFTPKVRMNDGEIWIGDSVVCSAYRLKVYGWDKGIQTRMETQKRRVESRWGRE